MSRILKQDRETIKFMEAHIFDSEQTKSSLSDRFKKHLCKIRARKDILNKPAPNRQTTSGSIIENADEGPSDDYEKSIYLSAADYDRANRRAELIIAKRKSVSSLSHLKREDRERLETSLRSGVKLVHVASEHHADELAATLHSEMPWMSRLSDIVWKGMRRSVREGQPGLTLPPLLLDGPPGIGKSHFARRLGQLLSLPTSVIEATGENASFGIVGVQRGWGTAHPGRALETVLKSRIANPVIVIDEIDKGGTATAINDARFRLTEALLPLLEPLTARRWNCPYYQVGFDMSHINWVLTANSSRLLPEPLLSRCPPIRLRDLSDVEVIDFIRREGLRLGASSVATDAIGEAISRQRPRQQRRVSLRDALRLLQIAIDIEHGPILH